MKLGQLRDVRLEYGKELFAGGLRSDVGQLKLAKLVQLMKSLLQDRVDSSVLL